MFLKQTKIAFNASIMKSFFVIFVSLGTFQCVNCANYNSQYNEIIKNSSLPNVIEEELHKESKFFDEFNDCKCSSI